MISLLGSEHAEVVRFVDGRLYAENTPLLVVDLDGVRPSAVLDPNTLRAMDESADDLILECAIQLSPQEVSGTAL